MTTKMYNILNFDLFYNEVKDAKISLKTAFRLSKLVRAIEEHLTFYREKMQSFIRDYAEFDGEGNPIPLGNGYKMKPGKEIECNEKVNELLELEVELPDISFSLDEFANVEITMDAVNAGYVFLTE